VARSGSPARLVIALSVAALLAVFLLYTSIAGGGTPALQPSELRGRTAEVQLSGKVVGPVLENDARRTMRFRLRDIDGTTTVPVFYRGTVPEQFKRGRHVYLEGKLRRGVFVANPDSLVTKCPSKYTAAKD
jgi:cytochrome c-type biogenesis protein CcmE